MQSPSRTTAPPGEAAYEEDAGRREAGLTGLVGAVLGDSQICRLLVEILRGLGLSVGPDRGTVRDTWSAHDLERLDVLVFVGPARQRDASGLSPSAVRAAAPHLVYAHIDDSGHPCVRLPGADAAERTSDPLLAASLGAVLGFSDVGAPRSVELPVADFVAALSASLAIAAALSAGDGAFVELTPEDAFGLMTVDSLTQAMVDGDGVARTTRHPQGQIFVAQCSDGTGLTVQNSSSQDFWERFATALGRSDLVVSPSYRTYHDRVRNYFELEQVVRAEISQRTVGEWSQILLEADVPFSPLLTNAQALEHPQVTALGLARPGSVPDGTGLLRPLRFDGQRVSGAPEAAR